MIKQGGIKLDNGSTIMPDPLLLGRNADKLQKIASDTGLPLKISTDLAAALHDPDYQIYFDAQVTGLRAPALRAAIAAGKHIYCEKPVTESTDETLELARLADSAGIKHGVVQDKLFLPGIVKLRHLIDTGFFGRILAVRGEFGYWVFEGDKQPAQRPSWNYRKEDGGGIIMDMLCHWRYVIDNLFGNVTSVSCLGVTHIPQRWDEANKPYKCTADDAAYATFLTDQGVICHFNSSWCTRVRRDDLLALQVDGTKGSAVAGLRDCVTQSADDTPRPVWNPDVPNPIDFRAGWANVGNSPVDNAFKAQWELFLRHVAADEPFRWTLMEGAKGVQLAEKGLESWQKRAWVDVPPLH
ncbi:MAG TPA: Gfo/Idh/MocA family oxidoreductase [Phycisphaerae bacterium]|nr:Gfo/Idh/MocA family oxidoreductase [Phycisphaerae bacterium]